MQQGVKLESTEVNLLSLFSQLAVFYKTLLYEPYIQNWWVNLNTICQIEAMIPCFNMTR